MRKGLVLSLSLAFLFASSCAKAPFNVNAYKKTPADSQMVEVPKECEYVYKPKKWEIAVVEFSNNTGYSSNITVGGNQTTGTSRTNTQGAVVGVAGANAFAAVGAQTSKTQYSSNSTDFLTEFAPSLGSFAQNIVEETLTSMGGIKIYDRANMNKILAEQKFQMSIADPNSAVKFGKLSGVRYIVSGSVDNIQASYTSPAQIQATNTGNSYGNMAMGMASLIGAAADAAVAGWYVSIDLTFKLIDTETGEVVSSGKYSSKERATQSANFQPDLIINAAKTLISKTVSKSRNELNRFFALTGYVNELRGGKKVALVSMGFKTGVKQGDVLTIYNLSVTRDIMTKEVHCNLENTGAKVRLSDAISESNSWGYITGNEEALSHVKLGSYVIRSELGEK